MVAGKDGSGGGHSLSDHMFGDLAPHEHGPDADHDHDDMELAGPIEDNPIWIQDHVTLRSVGIDIGSSGTQVVFSRIHLRRHGEDLTSRYVVTERETLYQSPVSLTPYSSETRIDDRGLGEIIDAAYGTARIHPDDIDTGVVILTGEALRRENAQGIAGLLSERGGDFVTATAGHHMESMLAAYGSGAARISHESGRRILNVDIGGGTTKLAVIEAGRVVQTAALHVGGRLIVADDTGAISRLDPAGAHHAARAGFDWSVGAHARPDDFARVAEAMADVLVAALGHGALPEAVLELYLTEPPGNLGRLDGIVFSGGVAEYVYGREARDFGDLGPQLGATIRERAERGAFPAEMLPAGECIRATALGASEHSVQLSGNTGTITAPGKLLPRRNLQVVKPDIAFGDTIVPDAVADAIVRHLTVFDLHETSEEIVLAFSWQGAPEYRRIRALAEGIATGMRGRLEKAVNLYVMLDGDIALSLGRILKDELGLSSEVLVIDGVVLRDFDYIDAGRVRLPSFTVPVTIKSLVFSDDPRGGRRHERIHHHGSHPHGHHHHGEGAHTHPHAHGHHHHNAPGESEP